MKNIKTTIAGIVGVLTGLGMLGKCIADFVEGKPTTLEAISAAIGAISVGVGLLFAKDFNVTGGTKPATEEAKDRTDYGFISFPGALGLMLLCFAVMASGCALLKGSHSVTVEDGVICVSTDNYLDIAGWRCRGICVTPQSVEVELKCEDISVSAKQLKMTEDPSGQKIPLETAKKYNLVK